jgi:hypothetical protein
MLKYRILFFFVILFKFHSTWAQDTESETPYYKLPTNRSKEEELRSIPNLKPFEIKYYFNLSGNFKKDYYKTSTFTLLSTEPLIELYGSYAITLGQNRNNNWFYEIGYRRYAYEVNNYLYNLNRSPLTFQNKLTATYIPITIKKRVFVIDKVSKNAQINIKAEIDFLLNDKAVNSPVLPLRISQGSPAQQFNYEINNNKNPVIIETGLELKGNITPKFEIGIFSNLIIQKPSLLKNNFKVIYQNGQTETSTTYLNGLSINFGLEIIINSPTYRRFRSISD